MSNNRVCYTDESCKRATHNDKGDKTITDKPERIGDIRRKRRSKCTPERRKKQEQNKHHQRKDKDTWIFYQISSGMTKDAEELDSIHLIC